MSKVLKNGITPGTCAAAAAKAAVLAWQGEYPRSLEVITPQDRLLSVPIMAAGAYEMGGWAKVAKDAGDDPDITHGATIVVDVIILPETGVEITAGEGVGTVTKPGLSVALGQPAVNPGPRRMIETAVKQVLPPGRGARITISIPGGVELAKRTLNPILGIEGGLSIIGTTGIVEPMSEEAFKSSLTPQIDVVKALGYTSIVFAPGKIGQDIAVNRILSKGIPGHIQNHAGHFHINGLDRVQHHVRRTLGVGQFQLIPLHTLCGGVRLVDFFIEANSLAKEDDFLPGCEIHCHDSIIIQDFFNAIHPASFLSFQTGRAFPDIRFRPFQPHSEIIILLGKNLNNRFFCFYIAASNNFHFLGCGQICKDDRNGC